MHFVIGQCTHFQLESKQPATVYEGFFTAYIRRTLHKKRSDAVVCLTYLAFYRLFSMYIEDSEDQREKQMKSAANCTCTIFRIHFRHCIFRIHFRQCIKKTQGIMKEQNGGMSSRLDGGRRREMDKWSERNKNESHDEWGCANTVTERKTDQHSALQKAEQCTKYIMQSKLICKCALLLHSLLSLC